MSEHTLPTQTSGAFRFWNRKDRDSKDIPDTKKGGLSKDFLWTFVLNNENEFDEAKCVQQLNEVRKLWAIIHNTKTVDKTKGHQHTPSVAKDLDKMVLESYNFMNVERKSWEDSIVKMQTTVNALNEENDNLKEQIRQLKNEKKELKFSEEVKTQIESIVQFNKVIQTKLDQISLAQENNLVVSNSTNQKVSHLVQLFGHPLENNSQTHSFANITNNKSEEVPSKESSEEIVRAEDVQNVALYVRDMLNERPKTPLLGETPDRNQGHEFTKYLISSNTVSDFSQTLQNTNENKTIEEPTTEKTEIAQPDQKVTPDNHTIEQVKEVENISEVSENGNVSATVSIPSEVNEEQKKDIAKKKTPQTEEDIRSVESSQTPTTPTNTEIPSEQSSVDEKPTTAQAEGTPPESQSKLEDQNTDISSLQTIKPSYAIPQLNMTPSIPVENVEPKIEGKILKKDKTGKLEKLVVPSSLGKVERLPRSFSSNERISPRSNVPAEQSKEPVNRATLTPYSQRKSSHMTTRSVSDLSFMDVKEVKLEDLTAPLRMVKMPHGRPNNVGGTDLFVLPPLKKKRSVLVSSDLLEIDVEKNLREKHSKSHLQTSEKIDKKENERVSDDELRARLDVIEKREAEVAQKEKEVLVVQIETENREEEIQAWEEDVQRREKEVKEREGNLRQKEAEIEKRENDVKSSWNELKRNEENERKMSGLDMPRPRRSEPPKTQRDEKIDPKEVEELKKEKKELEKTLKDKQLRMWTLEEQNKRVTFIVKMMDLADPSDDDIKNFVETIREIVNRKKQKMRFVLTQKIVEVFGKSSNGSFTSPTPVLVSPRASIRGKERKKSMVEYYPFIESKMETRRKTSLIAKDNYGMYRQICQDFYMKEKDYLRILNEFYEVYIKNINWSGMKEFSEEFKNRFEPILIVTQKLVAEMDRAYSDPVIDEEERSCVAMGSIIEKYVESLRVYLSYILNCPYFVSRFPVFSSSKTLTDSLIISISIYINKQKKANTGNVVTQLLPISTYLIAPLSHFSVYPELMRDLAMNISEKHFDYEAIKDSLEKIENTEEELDNQKTLVQRRESAVYLQSLFIKKLTFDEKEGQNEEVVFFGMLRNVDVEKAKTHEEPKVCFLFKNIFVVCKVKNYQGKVLDKKGMNAKFYQEFYGFDTTVLTGFGLEEVDRAFVTENLTVALIGEIENIKNGFMVGLGTRVFNFSAPSPLQQRQWCDVFIKNAKI